jgi:mono/diheme cytochrome c family protein
MKTASLLLGIALASTLNAQSRPPERPAQPTWSGQVAAIVYANCASCHRPGEAAPFPLTSYEEARRKAKMIAKVTGSRQMPPWHAEPGHERFLDERRLTEAEIETLAKWAEAGAPQGDPGKAPPLPQFPDGWQLGEPDLVVKMPAAFEVPAGGPDVYRNFVLPLGTEEDRWVSAIEVRPSARKVVHHVLFSYDETGEARRLDASDGQPGFRNMSFRRGGERGGSLVGGGGNSLGGWAVGATVKHLPDDLGLFLPKGADLILQTHFHPGGKREKEQTTVGIFFKKHKPARTLLAVQLPPFFGALAQIDIPAGEKDFTVRDTFTFPVDVEAISVGGHAHYLCTRMLATASMGEGEPKVLLSIPRWDFGWQDRYWFARPVPLARGTQLEVELHWDNSASNPNNPSSPPRRVRWGPQSTDEMGSITLALVCKDEKDVPALQQAVRAQAARAAAQRSGPLARQMLERLRQMDHNRDGKITQDEIPERQRALVLRADRNQDGVIDQQEIEQLEKDLGLGK